MDDSQILARINQLEAYNDQRLAKYRRNINRFSNNGVRREDVWNQFGNVQGYWFAGNSEEDTGVIPVINVIKSSVNTHVSKVSQTKVRPFFNPVNGSFDTRFVSRQAQIFFDDYFDRIDMARTATLCARDSDIFEYGAVWVDDESLTVRRVAPWEFYVDPAEYNFGKLSCCHLQFRQYPLINLADKIKGTRYDSMLKDNPAVKVRYRVFYDLFGKKKYHIIENDIIKTKKIDFDVAPIATLYYEDPIKGNFSTSMVDNQYTLQQQIDSISQKIAIAIALTPANSIFVPKGSEVKASMVSNQIGAIYEYMPIPGISSPVTVSTPSPISPMYQQMLDWYVRQAYEMEGISQLSAQQKKPSGINSGVALDTLQDVESERHNQFLQSYIRFYMAVASLCIEVFPSEMDILPKKVGRAAIKWGEIKEQKDAFNVQFSASSSLSKDPKTKLEQLEKLVGMGLVPQSAISRYMEMPDLESAYGIMTSSYDYNARIVGECIRTGQVEFSPLTDLQALYVETINEILRLYTAGDKPEYIERAQALLAEVEKALDNVQQVQNPDQPAPPPIPLEAGQIKALQELALSGLNPAQAIAIAQASFPQIAPEVLQAIFPMVPTVPELPEPKEQLPIGGM